MINLKRNEKGITLIALIITIVVLLILAVVAIGQAQETNIVGYAQNASSKYEQAQANEIGLMSTYENQLAQLTAEKVVLGMEGCGVTLTIIPETGTFTMKSGSDSINGNLRVGPVTQEMLDAILADDDLDIDSTMPTDADDYAMGIRLYFEGSSGGSVLVLLTEGKVFYCEGMKLVVLSNNVSEDTIENAYDKYQGNIIGALE